MEEKPTPEELKLIEAVRKVYRETNGLDLPMEHALAVIRLTDALLDIAKGGKILCSNCGGK